MIFTFLGTGTSQGVPIIGCACPVCQSTDPRDKRLRSSLHVVTDEVALVIDTGPDFRYQMLREKIQRVDAVLFTHQHKDHTAGLDDIRGFTSKHNMHMPLYGRAAVLKQLKTEFAYIFAKKNRHEGLPRAKLCPITDTPFSIQGLRVRPIELMHHRLPVFGFRIGDFTYITDANYIAEEEKEKLKGTQVLVLNALRHEPHPSHFSLSEAIDLAKELGVPQVYFTHISHLLGSHSEISATLPEGMALAYDGLRVRLDTS